MSINLDLAKRLESNSKSNYVSAMTIYLKLLNNIIDNPKEEKFRKFKRTNQRIANELLSLDGMEALLMESGFEVDKEEFVLIRGGLGVISKLKSYRDFFQKRLEVVQKSSPNDVITSISSGAIQKVKVQPPPPALPPIKISANKPFRERIHFPQILRTTNAFLASLEQLSDSVMQYEDVLLQKTAMNLIPIEKFKLNAIEKLRKLQKLIKSGEIKEEEPPLDDLILEELAEWFKNDFFTWVNAMPCRVCKNEGTDAVGTRTENGVRIEKYSCSKNRCNAITEFPRYNDIEKLLVTRSGRCGEFANCFTFLCRCLGYDARYVYSTSDHVWTEVYNHSKKRWIHIDPSENVFDSPLMYEAGWKRKLEYVLAFSRDDLQDVTWRYSNKHEELKTRRKLCSEKELIEALMQLRAKRQSGVSAARKKFLTLRTFSELSELLIIREPTENELKGRSSGSLSWRLQRGETNNSNLYVFSLMNEEKQSKSFNIRYSCSKDVYERLSPTGSIVSTTKEWQTFVHQSENIFRKVENDHKMAYLSRTEDSVAGSMQFKFDFSNFSIKTLDVKFETKTFENGKISIDFLDASDKEVSKDNLIGADKFSIRIRLSGGNGDCAYQHAQVFRQKLDSDDFPFQVSIKFN